MISGTVRAEEARVFDSMAGYHSFHGEEARRALGSRFEVFFFRDGWYWAPRWPGNIPNERATGPFATSAQAHEDADPWSPEYDDDAENDDA